GDLPACAPSSTPSTTATSTPRRCGRSTGRSTSRSAAAATPTSSAAWPSGWPRSSPISPSRPSRSATTSTRRIGWSQSASPTRSSRSGGAASSSLRSMPTVPLRVGVQLPEVERDVLWPEVRAISLAAEECGFDSVWLGDHLLYRGGGRPERAPWDVWTQLAALAAVTSRVRLGPLVAATAFRAPGMLARATASVDEVSGGRLVLGVGAGWNETEFRAFGIPFDRRVTRFAESFEVVRRL